VVSTRPRNPNSELHPSLSAAAIFPPGQVVMAEASEEWVDPSKSEPLAQLNSDTGGGWLTNHLVEFPPLGSKDLIRLGEDLLHVHPIFRKHRHNAQESDAYIPSVSNLISRGGNSPTGLSSEEATALAETFRKVHLPPLNPLSVPDAIGG